jgi:hypothetical protein
MLSSYRAELGGILASLYIIHRICSYFHIEMGQAVLYCDNKGAINRAFQKQPFGITPFLTTDYDFIHLAQTLVQLIPITTMGRFFSPDSTYVPLPSDDSTTTSMTLSTQSMKSGSATTEDSCSDSSSLSSNQAYLSLFFDDTTSSITSTPEGTLLLEEHHLR